MQADGKILVAGTSGADFALVRYNSDGSLDTSFSSDGKVTTDFGSSTSDYGRSVTVQADGKILVAGTSGADFALVRYNSDGSLDTSFSSDGGVTTDVGASERGYGVTAQADGKILVAGPSYDYNSNKGDFALVRYNSDGSLDTSFSSDGKVTTDFGSERDYGESVTVQADGKILVAGTSNDNFALVRYNSDGSLDTSFSSDGKVIPDFGGGASGHSVTVQADGKILVAGTSYRGGYKFALVRYNNDGSLDTSFDRNVSSQGVSVAYTENATAVVLDKEVQIYDAELISVGYGNASLILARRGGAQAEDQFSGAGIVAGQSSGDISVGNITIGDYIWDAGVLQITFNSNTTQALLNQAVQAIAYENTSNSPARSIQIDWTFSDGNIGDQGTGGPLKATYRTTVNITAVNDAPTGSVIITGTVAEGQTLTASNTLADVDGLGTIHYQWRANGTAITGATGSTYTLKQADVGKTISVTASYTDGQGTFEAVTGTVANNKAPTGNVTITGTATQGQTLTVINTLADVDGLDTVRYQWKANGTAITGATGSTYTLGQADVGKTISVTASYTDGYGTVETVTSAATTAVANVNDAPTGTVTITGTATQGQTLTAANTLADVDGLGTVSYQWKANGSAIAGATGSTYTLGQTNVGKTISVTASYTDAQGTVEAVTSTVTEEVANINDAPTGSVTINGTPTQGETLTAVSTLTDADGLDELEYQWLADGVAIAGANDADYSPTQAEVGKILSVTVGYTDMQGTAESVTSGATAAVANTNDEPTGGVTISGTATQGQTLTATHTLADADGLGTVAYQWLSDGNLIAGATGSTLVLGQAQVGHFISVKAQYTDGFGAVEQVQSTATQAVVNVNELPTGHVTITGTATQGQTLSATHTLADTDGLGALKYQWLADGVAITGATGGTFRLKQAQVDKVVSVRISYTDAQGTAESVTSAETAAVANVNDAPTGTVTLTGTAAQNQTLTVTNNLADVDGMGTVSYQWLANGAVLEGVTGTSLTLNQALVGKTISVQARYIDGFGTEEAKTSRVTTAVTNVNDAPTGSVTINGTATQGQTLTASNTLADADGLGVLKYQWLANGVAIAGATGSSLTLAQAQVGKAIRVQVKYTDGFGTQQTVQSTATELIANTNDAPTFSNLPVASQPVLAGYASALNDFKVADPDGGTLHLTVQANNGTVKGLVDVDTSTDGIQLSGSAASLNKALAAATFVATDSGPASLALTLSDGTALPVTATYAMQAGFKATNGDAADNTLSGGAGMDQLAGNDGNDNLNGGGGKDKLLGGNGNDTLNGGAGVDTMTGGLGDDTYYVDAAGDVVNESNDAANGGTDTVFSSVTRTLGAFQENLTLTGAAALNGTGNTLNNMLTGNAGANKLTGNAGNDVLTGGMGKDVLSGGAGADTFVFNAAAESTGTTKDTILDFVAGTDQIDLRDIDANTLTTGSNEAFTFIGKAAFSSTNATGQLRFSYSAAGNFVVVSGSTDADVETEFSVQLNGISTLSAADFLL